MSKLGVDPLEEESELGQHAGLCPTVSIEDGGCSASGSQSPSLGVCVLVRE